MSKNHSVTISCKDPEVELVFEYDESKVGVQKEEDLKEYGVFKIQTSYVRDLLTEMITASVTNEELAEMIVIAVKEINSLQVTVTDTITSEG